nr:defensin 2 [Dioryctria sylvestrella]
MKLLVTFALTLALVGASFLPKLPNNKRYQFTQIIIDNIDDNENSSAPEFSVMGSTVIYLENCVEGFCDVTCKILGWKHGQCVSANTCHCYN